MFQSSPGPQAGRYAACFTVPACGRSWFQSSPGPQAGRYAACFTVPACGRSWFQSSPGPQAGRYLVTETAVGSVIAKRGLERCEVPSDAQTGIEMWGRAFSRSRSRGPSP